MKEQSFFSTGQIAEHCGVNFRTVLRWINKGLIKSVRLPGVKGEHRVSLEDFANFLKDNSFEPLTNNLDNDSNSKVLIIDDEINMVNSIGRVFTSKGLKVYSADNGLKAGYLLSLVKPKILTLDLDLKDVNGFEFLKIIQGLQLKEKIWIVVISGGSDDQVNKAISMGADCYLKKPFSKNDLEKIISKFCIGPENDHEGNNLCRAS